jgi:hypothetical protein
VRPLCLLLELNWYQVAAKRVNRRVQGIDASPLSCPVRWTETGAAIRIRRVRRSGSAPYSVFACKLTFTSCLALKEEQATIFCPGIFLEEDDVRNTAKPFFSELSDQRNVFCLKVNVKGELRQAVMPS